MLYFSAKDWQINYLKVDLRDLGVFKRYFYVVLLQAEQIKASF